MAAPLYYIIMLYFEIMIYNVILFNNPSFLLHHYRDIVWVVVFDFDFDFILLK